MGFPCAARQPIRTEYIFFIVADCLVKPIKAQRHGGATTKHRRRHHQRITQVRGHEHNIGQHGSRQLGEV